VSGDTHKIAVGRGDEGVLPRFRQYAGAVGPAAGPRGPLKKLTDFADLMQVGWQKTGGFSQTGPSKGRPAARDGRFWPIWEPRRLFAPRRIALRAAIYRIVAPLAQVSRKKKRRFSFLSAALNDALAAALPGRVTAGPAGTAATGAGNPPAWSAVSVPADVAPVLWSGRRLRPPARPGCGWTALRPTGTNACGVNRTTARGGGGGGHPAMVRHDLVRPNPRQGATAINLRANRGALLGPGCQAG